MPEPITVPTTTAMAIIGPRARIKPRPDECGVCVFMGGQFTRAGSSLHQTVWPRGTTRRATDSSSPLALEVRWRGREFSPRRRIAMTKVCGIALSQRSRVPAADMAPATLADSTRSCSVTPRSWSPRATNEGDAEDYCGFLQERCDGNADCEAHACEGSELNP